MTNFSNTCEMQGMNHIFLKTRKYLERVCSTINQLIDTENVPIFKLNDRHMGSCFIIIPYTILTLYLSHIKNILHNKIFFSVATL